MEEGENFDVKIDEYVFGLLTSSSLKYLNYKHKNEIK